MPYSDLTQRVLERLEITGAAVRELAPKMSTFRISTVHLGSREAAQPLLDEIKALCSANRCLYVIQVCDTDVARVDFEGFQDRFAEAKDQSGRLAFPRLNTVEPSRVLYVGSSFRLSTRVKEHLGYVSDRTFALRLRNWVPDCNIDILVAAYARDASDDAILILEETLWHHLKPMFGRSGSAH